VGCNTTVINSSQAGLRRSAQVVIAEDKRATKAVPFALRAIELLVLPVIIMVPHGPADPSSTRAQTRTTTQSDYAEEKNTYDLNT